jgi:uncharacterized protein YuzE
MRVTYDSEADAIYIKLSEEKFAKVEVVNENTILNLDSEGNVIGIELLFVSHSLPKDFLSRVVVENLA